MNRLRTCLALMLFLGSLSVLGMDGPKKRRRGSDNVQNVINLRFAEAQRLLLLQTERVQLAHSDFHEALKNENEMRNRGNLSEQAVWRERMRVSLEMFEKAQEQEAFASRQLLDTQRECDQLSVDCGLALSKKQK
ncbi:hypothetical protein HOM50_00330 [bacterium]|jgi:hypothetical protein|nr:hypothetical protein [bacterium]MBT5014840.1 hypothetical protein [bacterium]